MLPVYWRVLLTVCYWPCATDHVLLTMCYWRVLLACATGVCYCRVLLACATDRVLLVCATGSVLLPCATAWVGRLDELRSIPSQYTKSTVPG